MARKLISEDTVTIRAGYVLVRDLEPYDITWAGSVVLRVDVCRNDEYREVTTRRNWPEHDDAEPYIQTSIYHAESKMHILL